MKHDPKYQTPDDELFTYAPPENVSGSFPMNAADIRERSLMTALLQDLIEIIEANRLQQEFGVTYDRALELLAKE